MRTYTQLTQEERYQISVLLKIGQNQTEIAEVIGKHKSTISREVRRNRGQRGYRPKQAHQMTLNRRHKAKPRIQETTWVMKLRKKFPEVCLQEEEPLQKLYQEKIFAGGD